MHTAKKRRRSPGEGSVFKYTLANGQTRFGIKFMVRQEDGSTKPVLRRRDENNQPWMTKKAAQAAVRDALGKVERNDWIDRPSRPRTSGSAAAWP